MVVQIRLDTTDFLAGERSRLAGLFAEKCEEVFGVLLEELAKLGHRFLALLDGLILPLPEGRLGGLNRVVHILLGGDRNCESTNISHDSKVQSA